jgi:ABC-type multidrug transport system fused ATPase/permease subunit
MKPFKVFEHINVFFGSIKQYRNRYSKKATALENERELLLKFNYLKEESFDLVNTNFKNQVECQKMAIDNKRYRYYPISLFVMFIIILITIQLIFKNSPLIFFQFVNQHFLAILLYAIGIDLIYEILLGNNQHLSKWREYRLKFEYNRCDNFQSLFGNQEYKFKTESHNHKRFKQWESFIGLLKGFKIYGIHLTSKTTANNLVNQITDDVENFNYETRQYFKVRYKEAVNDLYNVAMMQKMSMVITHLSIVISILIIIYSNMPFALTFGISLMYMVFFVNIFINNYYNIYMHHYIYFEKCHIMLQSFLEEVKVQENKNEYAANFICTKAEETFRNEITNYFKIV